MVVSTLEQQYTYTHTHTHELEREREQQREGAKIRSIQSGTALCSSIQFISWNFYTGFHIGNKQQHTYTHRCACGCFVHAHKRISGHSMSTSSLWTYTQLSNVLILKYFQNLRSYTDLKREKTRSSHHTLHTYSVLLICWGENNKVNFVHFCPCANLLG